MSAGLFFCFIPFSVFVRNVYKLFTYICINNLLLELMCLMSKTVLVIAAHPDDEILGSGGTIKRLVNSGYRVISVIVAKGRKEEEHHIKPFILKANKQIGVEEVLFLEFPNLLLETIPLHEINKSIEVLIR